MPSIVESLAFVEHNIKIFLFYLLLIIYTRPFCNALGDTLEHKSPSRMGFFDLNIAINSSRGEGEFTNKLASFNNNALGASMRMQSSFIGNYLSNSNNRIRVGDLLAAEFGIGKLHNGTSGTNDLWLSYSFEFGIAAIAKLTDKSDVGLTLTLLKFVRDRISPNVSGSNIKLRFRYSRVMAEGGIESRRDRIFGWLTALTTDSQLPIQYTFTGRYLLDNNRNFGARVEFASASKDYILGEVNYKNWWTLRLFYGLYF